MKSLKYAALAVLLLAVVGGVAAYVGWSRLNDAPEWYAAEQQTPAEREAAAARVERRVYSDLQNQVARTRAAEARAARSESATPAARTAARAAARAAAPISAAFTEDELNAFFAKWTEQNGWRRDLDRVVSNPVVRLRDGRILLAATVAELNGTVVSLHFAPVSAAGAEATASSDDPSARSALKLVRVMGGRLPLPTSVVTGQKKAIVDAVSAGLPTLRQRAKIAPDGAANIEAVGVALADELVRLLSGEAVEPVVFLPVTHTRGVDLLPARLTNLRVADERLTVDVELLEAAERAALLDRLRAEPTSPDQKPPDQTADAAP